MKNVTDRINSILSEWDPLNLGTDISKDEYRGLIPSILEHVKSKQGLTACLEDALVNKLEVGYDPQNKEHRANLDEIVVKLMGTVD